MSWSPAVLRCLGLIWLLAIHSSVNGGTLRTVASGSVATVHEVATEAGLDALRAGGNAVDAAVAAALMLGVVDGQNSGIGGGCFVVVRSPAGKIFAIDGRETAPAAATHDMYVRDGQAVPALSQSGPLAVGTPGQVAALDLISRKWGRLPLARALEQGARRAEQGFQVTPHLAARLAGERDLLKLYPEAARIFLRSDGTPYAPGETLRQPELAATYRRMAERGAGWFYRGEFARRTGEWMAAHGGILTARDFRRYQVRLREPVVSRYRDVEVFGFPPPSSGGVHVAQILNLAERLDVTRDGDLSPRFAHGIAESMRLAFADRSHWLGDPDFTKVPRGLISPAYAEQLAAGVSLDRRAEINGPGQPPNAATDYFGKHTTHLSAADSDGWWVALTATINTTLGSKVVIPGTGVVLNNEMDDFSAQPGGTNFFGLLGAEANAIAPGKRPLSSMSPTIVMRNGEPILAVGAAGGPTIISQTVLAVIRFATFGTSVSNAIAAPRLHHQWRPDELMMERTWPESTTAAVTALGHRVRSVQGIGASQGVGLRDGRFEAAGDPRVPGTGGVWTRPDERTAGSPRPGP